jgi:hypothetical protein
MTGVEGCRANPRSERRGRGDPHDNVDGAFQALASERLDVVIVLQTSMLLSERQKIAHVWQRCDCQSSMDIANMSWTAG